MQNLLSVGNRGHSVNCTPSPGWLKMLGEEVLDEDQGLARSRMASHGEEVWNGFMEADHAGFFFFSGKWIEKRPQLGGHQRQQEVAAEAEELHSDLGDRWPMGAKSDS